MIIKNRFGELIASFEDDPDIYWDYFDFNQGNFKKRKITSSIYDSESKESKIDLSKIPRCGFFSDTLVFCSKIVSSGEIQNINLLEALCIDLKKKTYSIRDIDVRSITSSNLKLPLYFLRNLKHQI